MKISKAQLKQIIKEELLKEITADQARQAADYAQSLGPRDPAKKEPAGRYSTDDMEVINFLIDLYHGYDGRNLELGGFEKNQIYKALASKAEFKDLDWAANDPRKVALQRRPQKDLMAKAARFISDFDIDYFDDADHFSDFDD